MIPISINIVEKAISKYKNEISEHIESRKVKLAHLLVSTKYNFNSNQLKYLFDLKKNLDIIILLKPDKLIERNYKIPKSWKANIGIKNSKKKKFNDLIIEILNYKKLRSNFYPKYFKELGIKTCVYCNAQLSVVTEGNNNHIAKFQVDHYWAKTDFPSLSISFYNLYPTCASCNNSKRDKVIEFNLYTDKNIDTKESNFEFVLDKSCEAKFLTNRNIDVIKFEFTESDINKPFQKTFDIQGIYDTQKDIVEELIIKKQIYNNTYIRTLKDSFPSLFNNSTSLSNRIIIGNYSFADEIHKRPLAKFTQDIARQLKLID